MLRFHKAIEELLNTFHDHGHEAFVVGGCVRDTLLSRSTQDIDISTSASMDEVKEIFKDRVISDSGIEYQSLSLNFKDQVFQVTSYRQDVEYTYHRFPKTKKVISYQEDVWRRDFTMNGLFWNPQKGLVDLVNGLDAIDKRQIKTIDNPLVRFEEDALRILRAVRFACELDFDIEEHTYHAMFEKSKLIKSLSRERITQEMMRAFQGIAFKKHLKTIRLLFNTVFEFDYYYDDFDLLPTTHPLISFLLTFKSKTIPFSDTLSYFSFTKKEKELLLLMNENSFHCPTTDKVHIKRMLQRCSLDAFGGICQLHQSIGNINESTFQDIMHQVQSIHLNEEPYTLAHLKIKGDECVKRKMELTQISSFLKSCLEDVIESPELNTYEYLSDKLDEWIKK
jgi:tRNA nucleotidyltransferase (CCA-adding enzyme)